MGTQRICWMLWREKRWVFNLTCYWSFIREGPESNLIKTVNRLNGKKIAVICTNWTSEGSKTISLDGGICFPLMAAWQILLIDKEWYQGDRERDVELVKRRIEDEKAELQQTINRDRDNMTKKLGEEHDQRRIEQMEVFPLLSASLLSSSSFQKHTHCCWV